MAWKKKPVKAQRKPPDKLGQLKSALTGSEEPSNPVLRAFKTLLRQDPDEDSGETRRSGPGSTKKGLPRR